MSRGEANVIVYDLMMRPVVNKNIAIEEGKINSEFVLPDLPSGPYILEVRRDGEVLRKKVIIQH
jgi:hypothetical protein